MKAKQERIQQILSETILALCNNGLEFDCELEVDGLLGITLDKKDVFLVKISEVIQGAKTSLNIGSKHNYLGSPSELAVEDDGTDNGNVHATKRLCTQFRSPKRKKPEDDDEASPQDLSQRTHSPFGVKQELLSNADSNSRGSPATVVRLSSPSFGNNSHWKQPTDRSANTDEDAPQPDEIDDVTTDLANMGEGTSAQISSDKENMEDDTDHTEPMLTQEIEKVTLVTKPSTSAKNANCFQCKGLLAKLKKTKKELIDYHRIKDYYRLSDERPRPGVIPSSVADHYLMQEFVGGSGIYVYPAEYRTTMANLRKKLKPGSKPPAAWLAMELLTMFYNEAEYTGPKHEPLDQKVLDAITTLSVKEGTGNRGTVLKSLDSKKNLILKMEDQRTHKPIPVPIMVPVNAPGHGRFGPPDPRALTGPPGRHPGHPGGPHHQQQQVPTSAGGNNPPFSNAASAFAGAALRSIAGGGRGGGGPGGQGGGPQGQASSAPSSSQHSPRGSMQHDTDPRIGRSMMAAAGVSRDDSFPGAAGATGDRLRSIWSTTTNSNEDHGSGGGGGADRGGDDGYGSSFNRPDSRHPSSQRDMGPSNSYGGRSIDSFVGNDGYLGRGGGGAGRGRGGGEMGGGVRPGAMGGGGGYGGGPGNARGGFMGSSRGGYMGGPPHGGDDDDGEIRGGYTESTDRYWKC